MAEIIIYTKASCPYCEMAKQLFDRYGASYTEIRIDLDESKKDEMLARSNNRRTVPQIFINGEGIGGYDDLAALERSGKLSPLLK